MNPTDPDSEWDDAKDQTNQDKHNVSFKLAQEAFLDPSRIIAEDSEHSSTEDRYFCIGKVGEAIITVRFTMRAHKIRIFGAGYWRKGKQLYENRD